MSGVPPSTVPPDQTANSDEERIAEIHVQPRRSQFANAPSRPQGLLGAFHEAFVAALWRTIDIVMWTLDQSKLAKRDFAHKVPAPQVVVTSKAPSTPPPTPLGTRMRNLWIFRLFQRLKHDLILSVIPTLDLLEGEEIRLDIHQAPYRNLVPRRILRFWWAILFAMIAVIVAIGYVAVRAGGPFALGLLALVVPLLLFAWAGEEIIHYKQWRLVITNWRTIVFVPLPRSRWLVDDIRLQAGRIQVVDVNYSPSRWWRLFQVATGARDLVISISGYGFKANAAEVRDGLIIPDIMPEDVKKLEEIVFKK